MMISGRLRFSTNLIMECIGLGIKEGLCSLDRSRGKLLRWGMIGNLRNNALYRYVNIYYIYY